MNENLLAEIKNYLDITWDDPATDRKVAGLIQAGICYLEEKAGEALDFEAQPDALILLKEYARYGRDGALDVFETNYRSLILDLQHNRHMARRLAENPPAAAATLPPFTRKAEGVDV